MACATAGISTSASTITRSSTMSQPTAMRPSWESSLPCRSSERSSTTVLATDRDKPNMTAAGRFQPQSRATPAPRSVATSICPMAPGTAMRHTETRSGMEKCSPTPNMSRITPISASCDASEMSPTNPGVKGPIITPASR